MLIRVEKLSGLHFLIKFILLLAKIPAREKLSIYFCVTVACNSYIFLQERNLL